MNSDTPTALVGQESSARLIELRDQLAAGESWALFTGAGLSQGAGILGWKGLVIRSASELNVDCDPDNVHPDNFPAILEECASKDASIFWSLVSSSLCSEHAPTEVQKQLLRVPFSVFVTTNLDCLLEGLHRELDGVADPRVVVYPDIKSIDVSGRRLLYLHGRCLCGSEGGSLAASAVMTTSSYNQAYATASHLPGVAKTLFEGYRVLFVGTGLDDPPVKAVLDAVRESEEHRERLGGAAILRPHFALVPAKGEYGPGMDYNFRGTRYGVKPIYYLNPEGSDHESLSEVVGWLSNSLAPAPEPKELE
jgi:SIR2-like protein